MNQDAKNAIMYFTEMCDSHYGNQLSINYAPNAFALAEHQQSRSDLIRRVKTYNQARWAR